MYKTNSTNPWVRKPKTKAQKQVEKITYLLTCSNYLSQLSNYKFEQPFTNVIRFEIRTKQKPQLIIDKCNHILREIINVNCRKDKRPTNGCRYICIKSQLGYGYKIIYNITLDNLITAIYILSILSKGFDGIAALKTKQTLELEDPCQKQEHLKFHKLCRIINATKDIKSIIYLRSGIFYLYPNAKTYNDDDFNHLTDARFAFDKPTFRAKQSFGNTYNKKAMEIQVQHTKPKVYKKPKYTTAIAQINKRTMQERILDNNAWIEQQIAELKTNKT